MATKTKKRPRSTRTKTAHLPGMEPPRIKEIDDAADAYFEAKRERMAMTETEVELKAELGRVLKAHKRELLTADGEVRYFTPDGLECGIGEGDVFCKPRKVPKGEPSANGKAE